MLSERLSFAVQTAYEAGRLTLAHFQTGIRVDLKENGSPVTEADLEAEAHIRRQIGAQFPGESILGEEQGLTDGSSIRWVIDPIDGTKSFTCGVPLFGTLLSCEFDGVPQVGAAYFPALDEMFYAERGSGAFLNDKPCQVSAQTDLSRASICCAGPKGMQAAGLIKGMVELGERCMAVRTWCDAYGHGLVASGRVEAMIDPHIERWDISAMSLIIEEAGGVWTNLAGERELDSSFVSGTPNLHQMVRKVLLG